MAEIPMPPNELIKDWLTLYSPFYACQHAVTWGYQQGIANAEAQAQAAADAELEACCEWLMDRNYLTTSMSHGLRAARRPKPPSLKQEALLMINSLAIEFGLQSEAETIRRALELLPDEDEL